MKISFVHFYEIFEGIISFNFKEKLFKSSENLQCFPHFIYPENVIFTKTPKINNKRHFKKIFDPKIGWIYFIIINEISLKIIQ